MSVKHLNIYPSDEGYRSSIAKTKAVAGGKMKQLPDKYYTDHSVDHLERILNYIHSLLEANGKGDLLSDTEKYVLSSAAYLHDIGMLDEQTEVDDDARRRSHHHFAASIIQDDWQAFGIHDEQLASIIAKVAEGHRGGIDDTYITETYGVGQAIRVDLLASLLFLGDELDVTSGRVADHSPGLLRYPPRSLVHYYRHKFTQGMRIGQDRTLYMTFTYPKGRTSQYHPLFGESVHRKIRDTIQETVPVLQSRYGVLIALTSSSVTIKEIDSLKSIEVKEFEKLYFANVGVHNFSSLETIDFHNMEGDVQAELFYKGSVRWEDIVNSLDIERSQFVEIVEKTTELHTNSYKNQMLQGLLICGEAGSGKSTILMRLAWTLFRSEKFRDTHLLWHSPDSSFKLRELQQLYQATQKPIVVFIDGLGIYQKVSDIIAQISRPEDVRFPILTVFASRLNEWDSSRGNSIPFENLEKIQLERLLDGEIHTLLKKLEEHGQLYQLEKLDYAARFREMKSHSQGQLLIAMLEATRGKRFYEIILDEYTFLKTHHPEASTAYEFICLFFYYEVLIPQDLLVVLSQCADLEEFEERVLDQSRLVIVRHPCTSYGPQYRPRHHTIAMTLITKLEGFNSLAKRLRRAGWVLGVLDPSDRRQRYVILNFLENIIEDLQREPSAGYLDGLREIVSFCDRHRRKIYNLHDLAVVEKHVPSLIKWSSLYRKLRMIGDHIKALQRVLEIRPNDAQTNYRIADILSRAAMPRESPEEIAEYFKTSYLSGNRSMKFIFEYLSFCAKNDLDSHIEPLIESINDFATYSVEESELRKLVISILKGYKLTKDRRKLATELDSIPGHLRATTDLAATEMLAYVDLFEAQNPKEQVRKYEIYLETIKPQRPKSLLYRLAHLSSKYKQGYDKSLSYYKEIYEDILNKRPTQEDFKIVWDFAQLAERLEPGNQNLILRLYRACTEIKPNSLEAYLNMALYGKRIGNGELAKKVATQGLEVAKKLGKFSSPEAIAMKNLLATLPGQ